MFYEQNKKNIYTPNEYFGFLVIFIPFYVTAVTMVTAFVKV